ncbi:gastrula zinc finger protein XlCGF7.1-like [Galendromus occidentalis]|uniref:Gastrula zinc finger protein XlCGF7.1-like n=1 Tax=Galendromus occidentalis TaxID=34638 RepID=A0AAJ6QXF2_9ACAR|nr:gastrula zinc finger protein XlCGF7.1-like [Galendromus occidentalis]
MAATDSKDFQSTVLGLYPDDSDTIAPVDFSTGGSGWSADIFVKRESVSDEGGSSCEDRTDDHFPGCTCCRYCDKTFPHLSRLRQHELTHKAEKCFSCSKCSKSFSRRDTLTRHESTHEERELLICGAEGCGQKFIAARYLRAHEKSHGDFNESRRSRNKSRKPLGEKPSNDADSRAEYPREKCDVCGLETLRVNMARHKRTSHSHGEESKLKCETCGLVVRDQWQLREHHKTKHSKIKNLECSECDKQFKTSNGLQKHERTHQQIKSHVCPDCGKSFLRKDTLDIHRRVHNDVRPHICEECAASFTQRGHLIRHQKRFHS